MSDLPTREELAKIAKRAVLPGYVSERQVTAILDAILPLVMRGPREPAIDPVTRLAIACGNADWDGLIIAVGFFGLGFLAGWWLT